MKDALKPDLTQEKLKEMVEQSYKSLSQSHLENNSITKTDITKDSHNKWFIIKKEYNSSQKLNLYSFFIFKSPT